MVLYCWIQIIFYQKLALNSAEAALLTFHLPADESNILDIDKTYLEFIEHQQRKDYNNWYTYLVDFKLTSKIWKALQ